MTYKLSLGNAFLMTIFPPLQLIIRVFSMKGSLDKPWLLLFMFPIFSVVPAIMMALGKVEEGNAINPYDDFMMLSPILYCVFLLIAFLMKNSKLSKIMTVIFPLIASFASFFLRDNVGCKSINASDTNINIFNSLVNALATHGIAITATTFVNVLPIIGSAVESLTKKNNMVAYFTNFYIYTGVYLTMYIIINMFNNANYKDYCSKIGSFSSNAYDLFKYTNYIIAIIGSIGILASTIYKLSEK